MLIVGTIYMIAPSWPTSCSLQPEVRLQANLVNVAASRPLCWRAPERIAGAASAAPPADSHRHHNRVLLGGLPSWAAASPRSAQDLDKKNLSPRVDHWFGTDIIGRDVFSRVIVGARNILLIAPVAAGLSIIAGTILGLLMGYFRGAADMVLSRIIETFLALPVVLVGLLALVTFGSSRVVVIGDTPLDIRCARAIGAKVLAVATGGHSLEELARHGRVRPVHHVS